MHVVLLCGYYYPDTVGGTEAYVRMLGRDLKEAGHNVTVAAPATGDDLQTYTHDGLDVVRYPVSQNPTRAEVRGEAPPAHLTVWEQWLRKEQPDLVHMHSLTRGCGIAHADVVHALDIPLFITIHVPEVTCVRGTMMRWGKTPCDGEIRPVRCAACDLHEKGIPRAMAWGTAVLSQTEMASFLPGRLGTALSRAPQIQQRKDRLQNWMKTARHIIVVADWLRDVLVANDIDPDHITVSRHGLTETMHATQQQALERRNNHPRSSALTVGFVGRFTPVKGVHVLIEAIQQLPSSLPIETRLYGMVQTTADQAYLDNLKRKATGDDRIQFCGAMTMDNRAAAFADFDLLAVPSTWLETGPYTVLEAYAAGIPVVGSDQGGIAERVVDGESGRLVAAGDPDAWARALQELYDRHRSGNWSWDLPTPRRSREVAQEMVDLCHEHGV